MGNLSNLYISQSFQSLIHLGTDNTASAGLTTLQDGYGNSIGIEVNTGGNLYLSGSLTASLQQGYIYVGNASGKTSAFATSSLVATVNTGSLVTTASFNSYTQSTNIRLNNLESTSASVNVSISNLNLTTSSFATSIANLNSNSASVNTSISNLNSATQSLQSQLATIGGQSGSWITESETGSFARYDVSNPWSANQTFTNISATSASIRYLTVLYETSSVIYSSGSNQLGDELTDTQILSGSVKIQGGLTINGLDVTGSLNNLNSATASLQGQLNNIGSQSGSWITESETGSFVTTSSFNAYTSSTNQRLSSLETNSASVNTSISNLNSATASFSAIVTSLVAATGSYATTASNNFTGSENISGSMSLIGPMTLSDRTSGNASSLVTRSGSIVFVGQGFTSGSANLAHISSSGNFINILMKNTDTTPDTIISGSGNIFLNPAAPTTDFKRYMTGGNIAIGGAGVAIPQISASMAWSPVIANNIFAVSATPLSFRGPVSSSQSLLNNNIFAAGVLTLGPSAALNFEKAFSGTTFTGNVLTGNLNAVANKTILSSSFQATNNTIGGTLGIFADSSSVVFTNNINYGTTNVYNSYDRPAGASTNFVTLQRNVIVGTSTNIYYSGSAATATGRIFEGNLFVGIFNSASLNLVGDASHLQATAVIGHGLNVTGSSQRVNTALTQSVGSAFFGRHNDQLGNKAKTAETIFAIGTGTPTVPKTGFLIDSGSNTFVEGTLSISGSTSLTGSLTIQSGSAFFANGNRQFNVGAFQSGVTQSGSANVSQSMNFETTDISQGVSIVSNSRITLANSGTYNIQFSSQFDRIAGSGNDTVYVWLKKNGVNYNSSAGVLTVSGGAAAAKAIAAWNYVVDTLSTDYWELCWQASDTNIQMITFPAGGNIPSIPSVILTVTQVR